MHQLTGQLLHLQIYQCFSETCVGGCYFQLLRPRISCLQLSAYELMNYPLLSNSVLDRFQTVFTMDKENTVR